MLGGWVSVLVVVLVVLLPLPPPTLASPLPAPDPAPSHALSLIHHSAGTRLSHYQRRLKIQPRECAGPEKQPGVCMFNFECFQRGGYVVGTCVDGFLFGACCVMPQEEEGEDEATVGSENVEQEREPNHKLDKSKVDKTMAADTDTLKQQDEELNHKKDKSKVDINVTENTTRVENNVDGETEKEIPISPGETEEDPDSTSISSLLDHIVIQAPTHSTTPATLGGTLAEDELPDELGEGVSAQEKQSSSVTNGSVSDGSTTTATTTTTTLTTDMPTTTLTTAMPTTTLTTAMPTTSTTTTTTRKPTDAPSKKQTTTSATKQTQITPTPTTSTLLQNSTTVTTEQQATTPQLTTRKPSTTTREPTTKKEAITLTTTKQPVVMKKKPINLKPLSTSVNSPSVNASMKTTTTVLPPTINQPTIATTKQPPTPKFSTVTTTSTEEVDGANTKKPTTIVRWVDATTTTTTKESATTADQPTTAEEDILFWSFKPTNSILTRPNIVQPTPSPIDITAETNFNISIMTTNSFNLLETSPTETLPTRQTFPPRPEMFEEETITEAVGEAQDWVYTIPASEASTETVIPDTESTLEMFGTPTAETTESVPQDDVEDTSKLMATTPGTTTSIPLLIWTLSPRPAILEARPPMSVVSQIIGTTPRSVPRLTTTPPNEQESDDDPLLFWTVSPRPPLLEIRPQTIQTTTLDVPITTTPQMDDPLAFWTTTRPPRPPPTFRPNMDDPMLIWTTTKRPALPQDSQDLYMQPPVIPGDVLQHITGDLLEHHHNRTSSSSSTQPSVSSSSGVLSFTHQGPIDNTLGEPLRTPTSWPTSSSTTLSTPTTTRTVPETTTKPPTKPTTKTTPKTTTTTTPRTTTIQRRPTKRPPPKTTTTLLRPRPSTISTTWRPPITSTPTTEQPISPIDQFIVDFINSSPPEDLSSTVSVTTTVSTTPDLPPPIDLELLEQLFNLTNFVPGEEVLLPPFPSPKPPSTTTTTTTTTARPRPTKRPRPTTHRIALPEFNTQSTTTTPTTTTTTTTPTTTTTTTPTTTTPNWDYRTTCGVRPLAREGRIVNGERSDYAEWPWQALVKESTWLGIFTKNKCGGVLLNRNYVLTAAHCQPGFLASLIVVLGEYDLSDDYEPKRVVQRNVKRVVVHRGYRAKTFDNDLALLEMEKSVNYDEHIVPICLPRGDEIFLGEIGIVTGWGRLSYGGPVPSKLNEVDLPVIRNDECQRWFNEAGHHKVIKPEFFCAGYKEGRKDSCEGDSGGPFSMRSDDGRWVLAGTVSHGIKCAYPNLPGVYMRMTYYKPWILSIIN